MLSSTPFVKLEHTKKQISRTHFLHLPSDDRSSVAFFLRFFLFLLILPEFWSNRKNPSLFTSWLTQLQGEQEHRRLQSFVQVWCMCLMLYTNTLVFSMNMTLWSLRVPIYLWWGGAAIPLSTSPLINMKWLEGSISWCCFLKWFSPLWIWFFYGQISNVQIILYKIHSWFEKICFFTWSKECCSSTTGNLPKSNCWADI